MISAFFLGAWGLVKKIPWQLWAVIGLAAALWFAYHSGQKDTQRKWDAANKEQVEQIAKYQTLANRVHTTVSTMVEQKIKVIEKAGKDREIVREVFIPRDSGNLSGSFRLYYDAAVLSTTPNAAEIPNAAPVPITDVAASIDANYAKCNKAYEVVAGFQAYENGLEQAYKEATNGTK
jgi:hypothetical protein